MKVMKLIKILSKMDPRALVTIDKNTFDAGNGCYDILQVGSAKEQDVNWADDDGRLKFNKDGSEVLKKCVVLKGS